MSRALGSDLQSQVCVGPGSTFLPKRNPTEGFARLRAAHHPTLTSRVITLALFMTFPSESFGTREGRRVQRLGGGNSLPPNLFLRNLLY